MPLPATTGQFRTRFEDMQIGDYIAYKAVGTSGVPCTISDIGAPLDIAQANEIPITGTASPNGYAYAVKNDKGMCISDRPIQHSVSWDALNSAKLIQGLVQTVNSKQILIRSLTGGNAYLGTDGKLSLTDKGLGAFPVNNEWDKYIVNSNLGGKIIAGDDNVWHWNLVSTNMCQDTPIIGVATSNGGTSASTGRILRGQRVGVGVDNRVTGLNCIHSDNSSSQNSAYCFRPVLQFIEPNSKSTNLFY